MLLLASCLAKTTTGETIWRIIEIYLNRRKCDESFRSIKQCYNLEDVRARHYTSLHTKLALILVVSCFAAVYLGDNVKLKVLMGRVYLVSKRFSGMPTFFNYAIADGLYNLHFPYKTGIHALKKDTKPGFQLWVDFWKEAVQAKLRKLQ